MLLTHDRSGPSGGVPVVLVHAGVADRRMWDPIWPGLTAAHDTIRVDLPGFGESVVKPSGLLAPHDDLVATLANLGVTRAHLVGASMGAGVVVEAALTAPDLAASLLLAAPGGSLIPEATPQLRDFGRAEGTALEAGDVGAAVEANVATWVDGPGQPPDRVDPGVRSAVAVMQRLAFELTADWDDVDGAELDPPALDRLPELRAPTLVLAGGLDVDAIALAADAVLSGVPGAERVVWPDAAHLPSMERPADFLELLLDWLERAPSRG